MLGLFRRKTETRAGGGYADAILSAFQDQAERETASAAATSATEAVSGLLARSLAGAQVNAPPWAKRALSPSYLAQLGRELVRHGEHLAIVDIDAAGDLELLVAGTWHWTGDIAERTWMCHPTVTGPSSSITRNVHRSAVVYLQWARLGLTPHYGQSPANLASLAGKVAAEVERSLGDEAAGPVAQLIALPEGADPKSPKVAALRAGLAAARGKGLLLESTAGGWGDKAGSPHKDWVPNRLGPNPSQALALLAQGVFDRLVAAAGASPALFLGNADGTSQRESLRRWHMSTVLPVARMIEVELSERLDAEITLSFDNYPLDMQARASTLEKLKAAGMEHKEALRVVGLLME